TADALSHTGSANPTPYAAQIDITASKLVHATYLAGNAGGTASAIAVATDGTVYVAGGTLSTDFPVQSGPFQSAKTSDYAIYLQRLDFSQTPPPTGNTPVVTTVVIRAGFVRGITPAAAIAIYGTNPGNTTAQCSGKPPTSLGGTSVSIDGKNIPLFYVSPTQINAQMPYEIGPSTPVLRVTVNGVSS